MFQILDDFFIYYTWVIVYVLYGQQSVNKLHVFGSHHVQLSRLTDCGRRLNPEVVL